MLLSSVILLLQETIEAAVLFAVLAALASMIKYRKAWLFWGLAGGLLLAYLYAGNMGIISTWFDYVGQEIVNAVLQISITLALAALAWTIAPSRPESGNCAVLFWPLAALAVVLAVTREGSEVFLYLGGFLHQGDKLQAVLMGSGIGFSIGLSLGFLLFYSLVGLPGKWAPGVSLLLLALFAGNMLAQAALQLIQADWISSASPLWDTSGWVQEQSITGQLLYALIGYEATPSAAQVASYLAGAALVLAAFAASSKIRARNSGAI